MLSDFVSTLDPVGNPTQIVQTGATPSTQTFSYDVNDRLLSVCFQRSGSGYVAAITMGVHRS